MELRGANGDSFALHIADYQFPDITDDKYDSNWLLIDIHAVKDGRSWQLRDPSLLTDEVESLAAWLEEVPSSEKPDSPPWFVEPNLTFELIGREEGQARIRIYFELESRPGWALPADAGMRDLWIDLQCTSDQLRESANNLRIQLQRFPERQPRRKWWQLRK